MVRYHFTGINIINKTDNNNYWQGMITLEVKLKTNVMDLQKKYVAGHGSVDTATIQELDGSQKNSVKANLST